MHNFQFTDGMQRLGALLRDGELGDVVSFYELQLSNKNRRLPEWYNDLPLGLFYDEAPHFMYLLEKYGGKLSIESAHAQFNQKTKEETPVLLSVMAKAGKYPVSMFLNFESPVCEWHFMVVGEKKIAIYDLFKDILIVLPTDNEHYAMDVLKNSVRTTTQFWRGFIKNGFKMVGGSLLYGHDVVMEKFIESVIAGKLVDQSISSERGKSTIVSMNEIVDLVNANRRKK
jgi:predicted dehydrogenase